MISSISVSLLEGSVCVVSVTVLCLYNCGEVFSLPYRLNGGAAIFGSYFEFRTGSII